MIQEIVFSFFIHILHNLQFEYDGDDYDSGDDYVGDDDADDDDVEGRVRVLRQSFVRALAVASSFPTLYPSFHQPSSPGGIRYQ